jgi:hypothetical protein
MTSVRRSCPKDRKRPETGPDLNHIGLDIVIKINLWPAVLNLDICTPYNHIDNWSRQHQRDVLGETQAEYEEH